MKPFTGIGVAHTMLESGPTLSTLSTEATATATGVLLRTSMTLLVDMAPDAAPHTNLVSTSLLGTTPGVKLGPPH